MMVFPELPTLDRPSVLGPAIWKLSIDWEDDVRKWNWYKGIFTLTVANYPIPRRVAIHGICFRNSDVEKTSEFKPCFDQVRRSSGEAAKARGRIPRWDYNAPLIALIREAHQQALPKILGSGDRGQRARLMAWIADFFEQTTGKAPEVGDLGPLASKILEALRK